MCSAHGLQAPDICGCFVGTVLRSGCSLLDTRCDITDCIHIVCRWGSCACCAGSGTSSPLACTRCWTSRSAASRSAATPSGCGGTRCATDWRLAHYMQQNSSQSDNGHYHAGVIDVQKLLWRLLYLPDCRPECATFCKRAEAVALPPGGPMHGTGAAAATTRITPGPPLRQPAAGRSTTGTRLTAQAAGTALTYLRERQCQCLRLLDHHERDRDL